MLTTASVTETFSQGTARGNEAGPQTADCVSDSLKAGGPLDYQLQYSPHVRPRQEL